MHLYLTGNDNSYMLKCLLYPYWNDWIRTAVMAPWKIMDAVQTQFNNKLQWNSMTQTILYAKIIGYVFIFSNQGTLDRKFIDLSRVELDSHFFPPKNCFFFSFDNYNAMLSLVIKIFPDFNQWDNLHLITNTCSTLPQ